MNCLLLYNAQHSVNMQHNSSGSLKAACPSPPSTNMWPVISCCDAPPPQDDCLAYCSDGLLVAVSGVCVGSLPLGDLPAVETGKIRMFSTESFSAELAHACS